MVPLFIYFLTILYLGIIISWINCIFKRRNPLACYIVRLQYVRWIIVVVWVQLRMYWCGKIWCMFLKTYCSGSTRSGRLVSSTIDFNLNLQVIPWIWLNYFSIRSIIDYITRALRWFCWEMLFLVFLLINKRKITSPPTVVAKATNFTHTKSEILNTPINWIKISHVFSDSTSCKL